ncbi:DUF2510 domain-containing protein [Nocardioides sp. R-C-SC26]|uniref:DUF2510 domain-containing protein n=1 Tax=Nocardioides sp. R-C-SC26 TaxID=2870414 RepID=UPI001E5D6C49|nr:DUF2510 domain-containing protein [Nocardioides sp. R-C-SC26]
MSSTPPGWYPDGQGQQRWWDGTRWTEHVAPLAAESTPTVEPASDSGRESVEETGVAPADSMPPSDRPTPSVPPVPGVHDAPTMVAGVTGPPGAPPTSAAPTAAVPGAAPATPPGYPPVGYATAGSSYPPTPQRRSPRGLVIGAVGGGVVLLVVAIVLVLALGRGGSGPERAAEQYFERVQDNDCRALTMMSEDFSALSGASLEECEDAGGEEYIGSEGVEDCDFVATKVEEDGDEAEVDYEVTDCDDADDNETGTIELILVDDEWLVDGFSD